MKKNTKTGVDFFDTSQIIKRLLFCIPFLVVLTTKQILDNDTYWLIKTGEFITQHGIPKTDFLTMHKAMDITVQQWLSSVLFYRLHAVFGAIGPIAMGWIAFVAIVLLAYKATMIFSEENELVSLIATTLVALTIRGYCLARPQIFTYVLVFIELIFLEKYVKSGNWKYLIALPILSVLQVNLHLSMWIVLLIIWLPYFANSLPIKIKGESISCCNPKHLIISAVAMLAGGIISPYGFKGLGYLFTSSIEGELKGVILELNPISFSLTYIDILCAIAVFIVFYICYIAFNDNQAPIRYHLLMLGTLAMAVKYQKLIPYFTMVGLSVSAALINNWNIHRFTRKFKDKHFNHNYGTVFIIILVGVIGTTMFIPRDVYHKIGNTETHVGSELYFKEFDKALEVLDKEDKDSMVLFNGFDTGPYLEFNGYTTYIDARAELFIEKNNHIHNYMVEYLGVASGRSDYREFIDKYGFTHLFVENVYEFPLMDQLSKDKDFEVIYKNEAFTIFKRIPNK